MPSAPALKPTLAAVDGGREPQDVLLHEIRAAAALAPFHGKVEPARAAGYMEKTDTRSELTLKHI